MKNLLFILIFLIIKCGEHKGIKGEIFQPVTEDGWKITVEHFLPKPGSPKRKYPAVFLHGIVENRKVYSLNGDKSFVKNFTDSGYDVWTFDLRGKKEADDSSWFFGKRTYNYSFDEHCRYDADTALNFILKASGTDKVNWIGHSMGGMVMYMRIGTMNENRVANLVTLGSPFLFPFPSWKLKIQKKAGFFTPLFWVIPSGFFSRIMGYTGLPMMNEQYLSSMYWYPPNLGEENEKELFKYGIDDESPKLLAQFAESLGEWSYRSKDGKTDFTENLRNIHIPALLVAGRRDHMGSPYQVRYVYDRISSRDRTMMVIGRTEGKSEDYGHVDLVISKDSVKDIQMPIIEWLNRRN
ncbi:MAG TPA: alpha/beta fold hydrolase [Leptospiraceae bacterium]|nr:alpha/beta fold hydrolase [Leptospiraceae bacterium]HMY66750.1 alpha/beta fold hydrolase [Leptospiraceae bacterium]HNF12691.1 alpha/beta fold hydrolase [Leptospiraceae bacterium]HNF23220.1 alpha/beta fold hydrolase [Leptospiraceae bacterium]HNI26814.1 alpha/beta fold hydrolase [Leptospiraceae bacterium]